MKAERTGTNPPSSGDLLLSEARPAISTVDGKSKWFVAHIPGRDKEGKGRKAKSG
jgi:hypothetical protein